MKKAEMKDKLIELFGEVFGGAEKTRWAIARQRIRRVCKAAQMMGYLYGSGEALYQIIFNEIEGEITMEKVVDVLNGKNTEEGRPTIDKTDAITMDMLRKYCRMNEPEFQKAFKEVEGYIYNE